MKCVNPLKMWYNTPGESMKKTIVTILAALLISGCAGSQDELQKYSSTTTESGFDTPITLIAYTEDEKTFQTFFKQMKKDFLHYHQLFDKYHDYPGINNIKTINEQAGIAPVRVDASIMKMLKLAKQYYEASGHQIDVTMGSVLDIWHDARDAGTRLNEHGKSGVLPDLQKLKEAKKHTGFAYLNIDEQAQTVYLTNSAVQLDVGAIAKGYATEQVAKSLKKKGLKHAIINAGGNVRLIGSKPKDEKWSIGIQSPNLEDSGSLASIEVQKDYSFVTSGDYQRYYLVDHKMIHHIIDPDTLMPADHQRAVTVIAKDSGVADALSTTLFTLSYEEGLKLINKLKKDGMDIQAVWVFDQQKPAPKGVKTYPAGNYELVITSDLKKQITFH